MQERVVVSMFEGVAGRNIKELTSFLLRAHISLPPDISNWSYHQTFSLHDDPQYIFETRYTAETPTRDSLYIQPCNKAIQRITTNVTPPGNDTDSQFLWFCTINRFLQYKPKPFTQNLTPSIASFSYSDFPIPQRSRIFISSTNLFS
jgi:hypothetical protein